MLEMDIVDNPIVVEEMSFRDLKKERYLKVNPMGTSPAFRDAGAGITMWESGAILDYLLEKFDTHHTFHPAPISDASTPEQIKQRTKYLQLKQYIIATVYPFIASMYIHSLKENKDEKYMEEAKKKCHTVLGPILSTWLGDGPYFLGEDVSIVDFLVCKPLTNVKALGLLGEFPKLEFLFSLVSSRSTYQMAYEGLETSGTGPTERAMMMVPPPAVEPKKPKKQLKNRFSSWGIRRSKADGVPQKPVEEPEPGSMSTAASSTVSY